MTDTHLILSIARITTAGLAGMIAVMGLRAYLHTRKRSLLALSVGAGILAAGYFAEGILVELAGWSITSATVLESVTTLVAAAVLVASIYLKDRTFSSAGPPRDAVNTTHHSPP